MRWLLVVALCSCTGDDVIYGPPDGNMPSEAGFVDTGVTMMDSTVQETAAETSADAPADVISDVVLDVPADVAVSCNNNIQDGTETTSTAAE